MLKNQYVRKLRKECVVTSVTCIFGSKFGCSYRLPEEAKFFHYFTFVSCVCGLKQMSDLVQLSPKMHTLGSPAANNRSILTLNSESVSRFFTRLFLQSVLDFCRLPQIIISNIATEALET